MEFLVGTNAHFIVFRNMTKLAITSFQKRGAFAAFCKSGKGVTRVHCMLVPLGKTAEYTILRTSTDESGQEVIEDIQFKGENVRYILPPPLKYSKLKDVNL